MSASTTDAMTHPHLEGLIPVAVEAFLASTGQAHTVTQLQRDLTTTCMRAALQAALAALPGGGDWVLVPRKMRLTPDALANIELMCGGPGMISSTQDGDRWLDGILWVGETEGDHGEKYYGLNIACEECLEEGSIPVCEFPALPTPNPHEADQ